MMLGNIFRKTIQLFKSVRVGIFISALLMLITGCATLDAWDPHAYRVQPRDTLYGISWLYQVDYRDVARWNNLSPPYTLKPGQTLVLKTNPNAVVALNEPRNNKPLSVPTKTNTKSVPKTAVKAPIQMPAPIKVAPKVAAPPPANWQWPVRGNVVQRFAGAQSTAQGIDISGTLGQAVVATASGRVVYSGDGLAGYGNLVIVKHNDTYLSAYAHNRKLLFKEGDSVKMGQAIAEMGYKEGNKALLHFEIRKDGTPVDPMKYLPAP
ncbi:MAG: peptidoglycan DD-metalloendopeptidase family protein [Gammaproteobacteria bacterium]|nr:peptidoglycan DD-metalloendopeptidase family protein [Gammaproteobacteria bacterium]